MRPALLPAQGGGATPPPPGPPASPTGGRLTGRPPPPPPPPPPARAGQPAADRCRRPGLPHDPDRTRTPGGDAPPTKGQQGRKPQTAPPRGGRWGPTARPPPVPPPPHRPACRGSAGPPPPRGREMIPPPPGRAAAPGREAGAGCASTHQPPALAGAAMSKRTRAYAQGRHTDRAQR